MKKMDSGDWTKWVCFCVHISMVCWFVGSGVAVVSGANDKQKIYGETYYLAMYNSIFKGAIA